VTPKQKRLREPEQIDEPRFPPVIDEDFDDGDGEFVRWRWPERDDAS